MERSKTDRASLENNKKILRLQISALSRNAPLAITQKAMERKTTKLQKKLQLEQEVIQIVNL